MVWGRENLYNASNQPTTASIRFPAFLATEEPSSASRGLAVAETDKWDFFLASHFNLLFVFRRSLESGSKEWEPTSLPDELRLRSFGSDIKEHDFCLPPVSHHRKSTSHLKNSRSYPSTVKSLVGSKNYCIIIFKWSCKFRSLQV